MERKQQQQTPKEPTFCGYWPRCVQNHPTCTWILLGIGVLLILIMVPLSFTYVEWNKWAFIKDTINKDVDTSRLLSHGRYHEGLSKDTVTFNALYIRHDIELSVASTVGQSILIKLVFYWRQKKEHVADNYEKFGTSLGQQVINRANSGIKDAAVKFSVNDYLEERNKINNAFYNALVNELNRPGDSLHIDIPKESVHIIEIVPPQKIMEINLNTAIKLQENKKHEQEQIAITIRAQTEQLVQQIHADTLFSTAIATATAENLKKSADAEHARMIGSADGIGINRMFNLLNVTDGLVKQKYLDLFTRMSILSESTSADIFN